MDGRPYLSELQPAAAIVTAAMPAAVRRVWSMTDRCEMERI
jgi:hypothetical protein